MKEIWKDIKGYKGIYQISNYGRVKSLERPIYNYIKKERIMKPRPKENGYLQIILTDKNSNKKHVYIHRLVAECFLKKSKNKNFVNHKNFNKQDNSVENLEWVSRIENFEHYKNSEKYKEIRRKIDVKFASKTIAKIKKYKNRILKLRNKNFSIDEISKKLNIGRDFVSDVLNLFND